jgi:antitoxin component YwqK of YwqJK toxin-antitoxin module
MSARDNPIFQRNVEKWSKFAEDKAKLLKECQCDSVVFTTNPTQESNLSSVENGRTVSLHSEENAAKEAQQWFASLDLDDVSVLFVYGVGLGYYYRAAIEWLRKSEQHYIVFFEDNLAVIHRLFETEMGSEILDDKQVFLFYFEKVDQDDPGMDELFTILTFMKYKVTALKAYGEEKAKIFQQLKAKISYFINFKECLAIEYINFGEFFFRNFYQNLLALPDSYLGDGLFERFKGVPAIICGAGPSLEKNGELLAQLKDKALILAGGTAVNTLNAKGILPHFGVQIDPNWFQMTRLIMNECYEIPFFYRNRFYHKAFKLIHGNRLYITGSGGYDVANWFEKELGIAGQELPEGHNVVNFSLAIATALGCNPIIFVGVDLAYTNEKSYADGVISHPLHDRKQHFQTKNMQEELMIRDDIHGEPIYTLWKWIAESVWFARFALSAPELILINATEGGLGLPGIPNRTLQEVADEFLQQEYDLSGWVHGEIQEHPMPAGVTRERIEEVINTMKESLEKCMQYCQILSMEFDAQAKKIKDKQEVALNYDEKVMAVLESLNQEIGYTHLLRVFSDKYIEAFAKKIDLIRIQSEEDEHKVNLRKADMNTMRFQFLAETARVNLILIQRAFRDTIKNPPKEISSKPIQEESASQDHYSFENGIVKIADAEMHLNIEEKLASGTFKTHRQDHANGKVKIEWTWRNNRLEGPFTFFNEAGTVLSKTWYVKGLKQGKAKKFYQDGKLYSLQRFKDGLEEGRQEYFYPEGQLKTLMNYQQGVLHGDVKLFFPNGQIKRELHFVHGKRFDAERMWASSGKLLMEVFYKEDKPIGVAREWRENGILSKEYAYDQNSKRLYMKQWGRTGGEIHPFKLNQMDYFDQVAIQTEVLTNSLEGVYDQIGKVVPIISEDTRIGFNAGVSEDIQSDLAILHKEIENLKKIGHQMLVESGIEAEETKEQIWKTPSVQKEVEKQLSEATARMGEEVQGLMQLLNTTTSLIAKKFAELPPPEEKPEDKQKPKPQS